MYACEVLMVGSGIVGLTIARELLQQGVDQIILLEKEAGLGLHSSGRNSGVLHAGIYYPPHTLKAQLCLKGNRMLQDYCRQNNLPLLNTGKIVVAQNESELPVLLQIYDRAKENGAHVELVDEQRLSTIEPYAKTYQKAIYSHYTAVIDPPAILRSLQQELIQSKRVKFLFKTKFESMHSEFIANTTNGRIHFKQLINTAGAYADSIAHNFGLGYEYYFIPFKGIYYRLVSEKAHLVKGNIYPVPHLDHPFLGVHFTKSIQGDVYVGPTAIPAFGREHYGRLRGMDWEFFKIIANEIILFCSNQAFRNVALTEIRKYTSTYFFNDANKIVKELQRSWLMPTSKVGIRPQLIDLKKKPLLMDFLILKERHTLHILNAISPAFTSSMAFAKHIVQNYLQR